MKYTENYKLLLPDEGDFFDVMNDNKNMDTLDTALKELKEDGANHTSDQNNPHNVTAAQVGASNPNLLINGDFQVWQRGTVFESGGFNFYTADRWFVISTNGNDIVKVEKAGENGGIRMISTLDIPCLLWYRMEENDLARLRGKEVTLSYSINDIISTRTFIVPINAAENENLIDFGVYNNDVVNWVKLELGSVATHFVPRPYGEELAACRRYYLKLTNYGNDTCYLGLCQNYNSTYALIALPYDFRSSTPTVNFNGHFYLTNTTFTQAERIPVTNIALARTAPVGKGIALILFTVASNLSGEYKLIFEAGGTLEFDAEIY